MIGAHLESWVKFLGHPLPPINFEIILGSNIGYAHGICCLKSKVNIGKLAWHMDGANT